MKLTAFVLSALLISPSTLLAGSGKDTPIRESAERAVAREVAAMAQAGTGGGERNPYMVPGLVMIAAGVGVAIAAARVPKLKTQTQDYDRCAQANGVATGPSNYSPTCGSFTETNKPLQRFGIGVAAAGLATMTVSAVMRNVTVQTLPTGGVAVKTTKRF